MTPQTRRNLRELTRIYGGEGPDRGGGYINVNPQAVFNSLNNWRQPGADDGRRGEQARQRRPARQPAVLQRHQRMRAWPQKIVRVDAMDMYKGPDVQVDAERFLIGDVERLQLGGGPEFDNLPAALREISRATGNNDAGPSGILAINAWLCRLETREKLDRVRAMFAWLVHAYLFEEWRAETPNPCSIRNIPGHRLDEFLRDRGLQPAPGQPITQLFGNVKDNVRRGYKVRYLVKRLGIGSLFFFGDVMSKNE